MRTNDDDETFTRDLLQKAGPRPAVPESDVAAITDAARAEWTRRYGKPRRFAPQRWLLPLAAAIAIGIGLAAWLSQRAPGAPVPAAVLAAHVERVAGSVALAPGQEVRTGTVIETEDGTSRVALRLVGGQSLRLDGMTRVRLVTPSLVELQQGALYVDSTRVDGLTVRTEAGLFTPVGTQFEVRVGGGTTQLRVREGRVAFRHQEDSDIAAAGETLSIGADRKIARTRLRADDPHWQWAAGIARMPPIEGQTLEAFLRFCAREQGWKLEYATPAAAALASSAILHGSVDGMALDDALRTVALSSGAGYRVRDGVLVVTAG